VRVVLADVLTLGLEYDGRFSAALLDPPCTGLGTLASRPDLRWRHRRADIERLAELQRRLLERAAGLVEPGGALTYSVCTLTDAETLGVIDPFLLRGGWSLDDLSATYPRFAHPRRGGCLLTLPSRDRTSGFFVARLRRDAVAARDSRVGSRGSHGGRRADAAPSARRPPCWQNTGCVAPVGQFLRRRQSATPHTLHRC
jgi:16S rRNA C967 or C1407 C5-methylase (RsmB/RsmF family)